MTDLHEGILRLFAEAQRMAGYAYKLKGASWHSGECRVTYDKPRTQKEHRRAWKIRHPEANRASSLAYYHRKAAQRAAEGSTP